MAYQPPNPLSPRKVPVTRRDATTGVWAVTPLVLADGEEGRDINTGIIKYGDGVHYWPQLPIAYDPTAMTTGAARPAVDTSYPNLVVLAEAAMQ